MSKEENDFNKNDTDKFCNEISWSTIYNWINRLNNMVEKKK